MKRRATTVEGLDEILQGGLPVPSTVLVAGEPGGSDGSGGSGASRPWARG